MLGPLLERFWVAKTRPRRPKMDPRWPQDGHKTPQDAPNTPQDGAKTVRKAMLSEDRPQETHMHENLKNSKSNILFFGLQFMDGLR